MAETWEVIVWTIVAVVLLIIFLVVIAAICACKRRNRQKRYSRRKGLEWGKEDETDFVKVVEYNKKSKVAKITDQPYSGVEIEKKGQCNVRKGEENVFDVVDSEILTSKQREKQYDIKNSEEEAPKVLNYGAQTSEGAKPEQSSVPFEEKFQSTKTEVTKAEFSKGKVRSSEKQSEISPLRRERLQPMEVVQPQKSDYNHHSINNYTNVGYNQTHGEHDVASTVQFQQPVAIVRTMVHPGPTRKFGKTKSLTRNYSKLNYKKSLCSSTIPRRMPVLYYWSLNSKKPLGPQSWINVPISYKENHYPIGRRKVAKNSSSKSRDFKTRDSGQGLGPRYNLTREKYTRIIPPRTSERRLQRRSLKGKRITGTRRPPAFNDVLITDSQPSYERSVVRKKYRERSSKPESQYDQRSLSQVETIPLSDVPRNSVSPASTESVANGRNVGDYYEENYRMVRRSEFPGKAPSKVHQDVEPDMVSICGSEFSDYLQGPPRPSDSQSEDLENWAKKGEKNNHLESYDNYSYGSYQEYSSRLQNVEKEVSRDEMETVEKAEARNQQTEDLTRHASSFQDTLKTLKNGNHRRHDSTKQEVAISQPVESPWLNNDDNFRKAHGVPISGVPVLPPEPVFVQTVETDKSDDEIKEH